MMNLLQVVALLFFTAVAFAQRAVISYPPNGASVPAGQNLTVQITKPNSLTGSEDVSVAIGLADCTSRPCLPASSIMGNILFKGPYNPKYQQANLPPYQPYQNYTVAIPASWNKGPAQLNIAHFVLIGAGEFPSLDTYNTSITIV